jgi:hypothetical protein
MGRAGVTIVMRALALLLLLPACNPKSGSLADCVPTPPPVAVDTIDDTVPPVVDAELQAWLAAGSYTGFLPESGPHDSEGPHGGTVRTFLNRQLAGSLDDCAESHPVGSAAVKELFDDGVLDGWAVMVKTQPGPGADAWYWYEVFSTAPDADAPYSGQANDTCTGCHDGGLDAVRTRWPLI